MHFLLTRCLMGAIAAAAVVCSRRTSLMKWHLSGSGGNLLKLCVFDMTNISVIAPPPTPPYSNSIDKWRGTEEWCSPHHDRCCHITPTGVCCRRTTATCTESRRRRRPWWSTSASSSRALGISKERVKDVKSSASDSCRPKYSWINTTPRGHPTPNNNRPRLSAHLDKLSLCPTTDGEKSLCHFSPAAATATKAIFWQSLNWSPLFYLCHICRRRRWFCWRQKHFMTPLVS